MITTYCTDTYYRWAILFLKSFKTTNGEKEKICINTLNLKEDQVNELQGLYKNLIVRNETMTFEHIYGKLGMTQSQFEIGRVNIKEGYRGGTNRHVISFFAVDKRVESINKTVNDFKDEKYFIQCDIDLLFRNPIDEIIDMNYDAGLRFKLHREWDCKKINIGFQFLKNNPKTVKLVSDWLNVVNSVPLEKRDISDINKQLWGQYTFYEAYKMNKDLKCFTITDSYFDNNYFESSVIWSANRRIAGNKTNTHDFLIGEYENNICNRR